MPVSSLLLICVGIVCYAIFAVVIHAYNNTKRFSELRHSAATASLSKTTAVCPQIKHVDAGVCVGVRTLAKCFPSFVIVGSMKAGTGVLMHLLNQHPLLISGKGENGSNEIHFFKSSQLDREENNFPCSSRDAWTYLMRFPDFRYKNTNKQTGNYKKTFDKSPDYMRSRESIRAMQLMLPSAKLIVLLRNPATRAISEFNHNCRHGRYFRSSQNAANFGSIRHLHDLSQGDMTSSSHQVLRYPCSLEDFREYFFGGPNGRQLRTYARKEASHGYYAQQMQWLLESFPARQVLVLFQEEMAANTLGTLKEVERFLGVPHHRYTSDIHQSRSKIASGNTKLYDQLVREDLEALYRPHNLQLLRLLSHAFNISSLPREWGDRD